VEKMPELLARVGGGKEACRLGAHASAIVEPSRACGLEQLVVGRDASQEESELGRNFVWIERAQLANLGGIEDRGRLEDRWRGGAERLVEAAGCRRLLEQRLVARALAGGGRPAQRTHHEPIEKGLLARSRARNRGIARAQQTVSVVAYGRIRDLPGHELVAVGLLGLHRSTDGAVVVAGLERIGEKSVR